MYVKNLVTTFTSSKWSSLIHFPVALEAKSNKSRQSMKLTKPFNR